MKKNNIERNLKRLQLNKPK